MKTSEKFVRLHFQRPSDFPDAGETDVLATSLNAPDVGGM
jgi:hypothetical protein